MNVFDYMAWAKRQQTGSVGRKAVLMALAERTGDEPTCYPSQALIAAETEQGVRTIRRHLDDLEALGLISSARRYVDSEGKPIPRGKACNQYRLLIDQPANLAAGQETTNRPNGDDQPATEDRPTGQTATTNRPPVASEVPVVEHPSLEHPSQNGVVPFDRFPEFWAVFPKGTFKKDAKVQFDREVKTGADPQDIIDGAISYATSERVLAGFIMDPHRWLKAQRWTDENRPGAAVDHRSERQRKRDAFWDEQMGQADLIDATATETHIIETTTREDTA